MKYITTILAALFCALSAQTTRGISVPLGDLHDEITDQLSLASNNVLLNKKLISQLNAALKTLDKVKSDSLADETKTLSLVIPMLNKTSLSNVFDAELQLILDIYTSNYVSSADSFGAQLANTFPGKKHDSAQKALDKLLAAIQAADTNMDSTLAAKALSKASKTMKAVEKAVSNAINAKLPPASMTATISIPGEKDIKFSSKLGVGQPFAGGNFVMNAVSTTGSGFNTKIQSLLLILPNLVEGANSVTLSGSGNQFTTGGLNGSTSFIGVSGNAQVVWVSASKAVSGTFTFTAAEQAGLRIATITGSFTAVYQ
jgi:hypothetical protein